jgi:hypothetical protein
MSLTFAALQLVAFAVALPATVDRLRLRRRRAPVLADLRMATADVVHRRLNV